MNLALWLAIGGAIGWLAGPVLRTEGGQGVFMNVVVGIVGALVGGWLVGPLLDVGTPERDGLSPAGVLVSLLGAVLLLALVDLLRRARAR